MVYFVLCCRPITDGVSAVNLTSHNRINSAEIIGYNPFRRNNNSFKPFIITYNGHVFIYFHRFYKGS